MSRDANTRAVLPSRCLVSIGCLLSAIVAIAAVVAIWDSRLAVYRSYQREMANLGLALAEQAARSLQAVDLVLQETQRDLLAAEATDPAKFAAAAASESVHRYLMRQLKNLPQADVLGVVGADGRLISGSRRWPSPPLDLSDRDWFIAARDHADQHPFVSQVVKARSTGRWMFYLSRRLSGPHGEFLGVLIAGLEARYFEDFYGAIELYDGGSVSLLRRDGTLLARYPHAEAAMGRPLDRNSPWYARVNSGGGTYHSPGLIDGIPRFVSVHPMRDYPIAVTITVGETAISAEWRRQALLIAMGAFCVAAGMLALFVGLAARSRRLERSSAELQQLAAALRQSEARFRDFALTSSDWFWETDAQHRLTYVSEGVRTLGHEPGHYVGRSRMEAAATSDRDTDREKWDAHIAMLDRHVPFRNFVYTAKPADRPARTVSISGKPFFDASGRFLGYRGTGRDVTEEFLADRRLREAKAAAEAANDAKTRFLANVSHELRTPLNAILGFSEMLELGMVGPLKPEQQEYIGLIRHSGSHLHDVINDILDFAKMDAGRLDLHEEPGVDPRCLVASCFAIVRERARTGGLELSASFAEPIPLLTVDKTRLKQIMLNLLSNAIKFTEPGGSVSVRVLPTDAGGIAFEVCDTGVGMSADEIAIAMEPFGQVDGGLARRYEGTGLGLPLARRLIELHDGELSIESEKGRGTVVRVMLPAGRITRSGPSPHASGEEEARDCLPAIDSQAR